MCDIILLRQQTKNKLSFMNQKRSKFEIKKTQLPDIAIPDNQTINKNQIPNLLKKIRINISKQVEIDWKSTLETSLVSGFLFMSNIMPLQSEIKELKTEKANLSTLAEKSIKQSESLANVSMEICEDLKKLCKNNGIKVKTFRKSDLSPIPHARVELQGEGINHQIVMILNNKYSNIRITEQDSNTLIISFKR
jgi:hypothetical protein